MNEIIDQIKPKMQKSIDSLMHEFNKIRTGRANPNILDILKLDKALRLAKQNLKLFSSIL